MNAKFDRKTLTTPGPEFVLSQLTFSDDNHNLESFSIDAFPVYKAVLEMYVALKLAKEQMEMDGHSKSFNGEGSIQYKQVCEAIRKAERIYS